MSFALPSVKVKPGMPEQFGVSPGDFGPQNLMTNGLSSARCNVDASQPLMISESKHHQNVDKMNMSMLRNIQGLHAPLRLAMELKFAKKIGRLPFLSSSNIMHEVLSGRDLEIGPEDVFNTPEFCEVMGQPHAVVERSLALL